jgi:hypothetical protein
VTRYTSCYLDVEGEHVTHSLIAKSLLDRVREQMRRQASGDRRVARADAVIDWPAASTGTRPPLLILEAENSASVTALAEVAKLVLRPNVAIVGAPSDRHSWNFLVHALHDGQALVCVTNAESTPPSVLAALHWLSRRFSDPPEAPPPHHLDANPLSIEELSLLDRVAAPR